MPPLKRILDEVKGERYRAGIKPVLFERLRHQRQLYGFYGHFDAGAAKLVHQD